MSQSARLQRSLSLCRVQVLNRALSSNDRGMLVWSTLFNKSCQHAYIQRFAFLGEFTTQYIACEGWTIELAPGYDVLGIGLAFDVQSVATLNFLTPTREMMLRSECLEPAWNRHPLRDELGSESRGDLVAWKRESAPDLPFYNHIMKKRKSNDWLNARYHAKRANSHIDDDSEDDEWE
eukprot:COSAG01_NODE_8808_length_2652_cov_1.687427_4_plen_178_part_00